MSVFSLKESREVKVAEAKVFSVSKSKAQVAKLVPQPVEERV